MAAKGDSLISSSVLAKFLAVKIHRWRGKYSRLFCLTGSQLLNVDPDNFQVTNTWSLPSEFVDFEPSVANDTEFTLTMVSGRSNEVFKFGSDFRSDLLCELARVVTASKPARGYQAIKLSRAAQRIECVLQARGWGLVQHSSDGKLVQTYSFREMEKVQRVTDDSSQLAVFVAGRPRLFACPDRSNLIKEIAAAATRVGKAHIIATDTVSQADLRKFRASYGHDSSPKLLELDVLKRTPKYHTPRSRKLVITEKFLLERDTATYQVVSARSLDTVHAVIRHDSEPQTLTFEYTDSSSRTYVTSKRDQIIAAVLDAAHLRGNLEVDVRPMVTPPGARAVPRHAVKPEAQQVIDTMYLAHVQRVCKATAQTAPYSSELIAACAEFNANVPVTGVPYGTKRSAVAPSIQTIALQLQQALGVADVPPQVLSVLLATMKRLVSCLQGYKFAVTLPEFQAVILRALAHHDDGVLYNATELLGRLVHNPQRPPQSDADTEVLVKKLVMGEETRVQLIHLVDSHSSSAGGTLAAGAEGTLVIASVVSVLDSLLISHVDTTQTDAAEHLMRLVASRYASLLAMMRSDVPSIVACAAMLMRAIVTKADSGTVRAMQAAALSTGVLLRHFFNSIYAASFDQRYVSRYLVELWATGNATAHDFFRHSLPTGLLVYLDMPALSDAERQNLEMMERSTVDEAAAAAAAAGVSNPLGDATAAGTTGAAAGNQAGRVVSGSGLASRLRQRLAAADAAEAGREQRRLAALTPEVAGSTRRTRFGRDNAAENARKAAHAAAAEAAVAAQAIMTQAKLEDGGRKENYTIFFHMIMQDHNLPDLIWNQQTRGELRAALDNELREVEMEIVLGGAASRKGSVMGMDTSAKNAAAVASAKKAAEAAASGMGGSVSAPVDGPRKRTRTSNAGTAEFASAAAAAVKSSAEELAAEDHGESMDVAVQLRYAWNHAEFQVNYPSLAQELKVGDQYLRLFLEGGTAGVRSLREATAFFDALYRRTLRETAPNLKSMCLKGMARVYEVHYRTIGPFEDTDYIVWMLSQTWNNNVRDHLLLLLHALALHPVNCEKMVNDDALRLFVDLLATAHTVDDDRRAMPVARVGAGLLLTDGRSKGGAAPGAAPASPTPDGEEGGEEGATKGESMKVWHYQARPQDLREGEEANKGPFSLQEMHRLGQTRALSNITMVWAHGMRQWVRLDSMRPVAWYVLSEGEAQMTPLERGELAAKLLLRLAKLRPPVDAEGYPVRPVPKVKRVLSSAACLPHIAQSLLAGSTDLVDLIADLIVVLLEHNPKAVVKLYLTGLFFFIMLYPRSNFGKLAALLEEAHLEQSFHHEASSIARENTLSKQSILGDMLPESLLFVLVNRGAEKFMLTFLSNVDDPEVIWTYGMRNHLVEMVTQHLGDLPGRLAANPCTLYDYCPIPRVTYPELEDELWCANYYLANLTDETRFPDWPIQDAVNLLRAVLDAWRLEMDKEGTEEAVSVEEAAEILAVDKDADDKTIRKAYRKAAMKYHPDKNPAGREMFEKIQVAYEMLTSARPEAVAGPDPVAITLMIRTQCILFKRYAAELKPYKYAGYPLLLGQNSLLQPPEVTAVGPEAPLLEAAANCVYLTCLASPRNADELVREQGVEILLDMLSRAVRDVNTDVEPAGTQAGIGAKRDRSDSDSKPAHGDHTARGVGAAGRAAQQSAGQVHGIGMLEHVLHTLSGLATIEEARIRLNADANFPKMLVSCLRYTLAPKVMQYAMDCVIRLSCDAVLQDKIVDAGVVWRLLPLLFRYDMTLEEAQAAGDVANTQKAANMQAKLAVRCFSRLGGYLDGAQATPKNDRMQRMMRALLTPILARRLVRLNPEALLETVVNTVERADVVWTSAMRTELLDLAGERTDAMDQGMPAEADQALDFHYKALADLLQLSGVYVKFYLADPGLTLDDPYAFCRDLLRHVAYSPAGAGARNVRLERLEPGKLLSEDDAEVAEECQRYPMENARRHLRTALRALHLVVVNNPGLEDEISGDSARYLGSLFQLLHVSEEGLEIIDDLAELSDKKGGAGGGVALQSAAGSGLSAGAGGARSTAASSTAPLRELVLTAIASFISNDECASTVTNMHLIPGLIRMLPHDAGGVGSVLRTLFTHTCVVEEVAATGCIIDLCTIFAGGVASGPAPGTAGGPSLSEPPKLTMSAAARAQAGALLSLICTDTTHGPPNLMALTQLLPDALARQVQQSLASATGTGSGAAGVGTTGSGTGAAGAANSSGALGDAVKIFDADHETPELVWDATSRHELRVALGELGRGLTGFRQRLGSKEGAAGPDSVRWSMPAVFRVRYTVTEGELRVGGVYVRLFLKEPTFPLRDPKGFLEALLRRLVQEGNHLIGMTSDDSVEVAQATAAAKAEAEDEEKSGGVKVTHVSEKKKSAAAEGGSTLVLRGEDVATQVTHAIVCLLRTRGQLCEHVAALGYVDTLVPMLGRCAGKAARFDLSIQCIRVLQVLGTDKVAVVAMAKCNAVRMILRSMQPLHRDAAFTLEALEEILKTDQQCGHGMVQQMLQAGAIAMLMQWISTEDTSHLMDQSAFKVHAIAIVKLLESDELHGAEASSRLGGHSSEWDKYKHQKHDLFISKNDTRDYFLADVEKAPSLLLKNAGEPAAASSAGAKTPSKRSAAAAPSTPLMLQDDTKPPPPPGGFGGDSGGGSGGFGGFQAPAPAPSGFGGFQAPAPAASSYGAPPPVPASRTYGAAPSQAALFDAPAPAPAPARAAAGGGDPFAGLVGGSSAPAPAPAPKGSDPFSGMGAPAPAPARGTSADPFADLMGGAPAPAPAPAAGDDLFAGMTTQAPAPAPAPAKQGAGYKDPFAGLMD